LIDKGIDIAISAEDSIFCEITIAMKRLLRAFLNSLKLKYKAETDIHAEIEEKIGKRVSPLFRSAEDFLLIEQVVLKDVEETYRRMLTTKRDLKKTRSILNRSIEMTRRNLEVLYRLATRESASVRSENGPLPVAANLFKNRLLPKNKYMMESRDMELGFGLN
jgi:hypothetical protein